MEKAFVIHQYKHRISFTGAASEGTEPQKLSYPVTNSIFVLFPFYFNDDCVDGNYVGYSI